MDAESDRGPGPGDPSPASPGPAEPTRPTSKGKTKTKAKGKTKKVSRTDPEASMATSSRAYHLEPSYKQHTAVDDQAGVIVDVEVTTGEVSEGRQLLEQIDRVEAALATEIDTVTADAGYAHDAPLPAGDHSG